MLTFQTFMLLKNLMKFKNPVVLGYGIKFKYCCVTESDNITYNSDNKINHSVLRTFLDETKVSKFLFDEMYYLEQQGYIVIENEEITVAHQGKHFVQFSFIKFCEFCYKSILVPILVAFITAYLTVRFNLF